MERNGPRRRLVLALAIALASAPVLGRPAGDPACLAAGGSCRATGPGVVTAAPASPGGVALECAGATTVTAADGALARGAEPGAPGAGWPPLSAGPRGDPCADLGAPSFGPAFPRCEAARAPPV